VFRGKQKRALTSPLKSSKKIKALLFFLACFCATYSQHEVIKISENYTDIQYAGLGMSNGGSAMDEANIYLIARGRIFVQSRSEHNNTAWVIPKINNAKHILFSSICVDEKRLYLFYLGVDGMHYLCSLNKAGADLKGPVNRHGRRGRIMAVENGIVVSGLYRPLLAKYLKQYDDEGGSGPTEAATMKAEELFNESDAYFLSVYDESFQLRGSTIPLTKKGEAAKAHEELWMPCPIDIDEAGDIYLITHLDGYSITRLDALLNIQVEIPLWNENFRPTPKHFTAEEGRSLNATPGSISRVHTLFVNEEWMLTSFYQNPNWRKLDVKNYFLDIFNKKGVIQYRMNSQYPAVLEDQSGKVFFAVVRDGGWFSKKEIYLVGLTIPDIMSGRAEPVYIDEAIERYTRNNAK
jgi:hypothetical protein